MGHSLGSHFAALAAILASVPELELGVCLDTAHLFQAGYPIHTEQGLERTLEQIDQTFGLERVKILHVNDSRTALGSRLDRHEHIGRGRIGALALTRMLRHPLLSPQRVPGRAFLLETPIDKPGDDRRNVAALWKLVGVAAEQVPNAVDGFSMLRRKSSERRGKAMRVARPSSARHAAAPRKTAVPAKASQRSRAHHAPASGAPVLRTRTGAVPTTKRRRSRPAKQQERR
jgi:Xylose isomerase-like TIM barrel